MVKFGNFNGLDSPFRLNYLHNAKFRKITRLSISTHNAEGDLPAGNLMAQKIAGGGYRFVKFLIAMSSYSPGAGIQRHERHSSTRPWNLDFGDPPDKERGMLCLNDEIKKHNR